MAFATKEVEEHEKKRHYPTQYPIVGYTALGYSGFGCSLVYGNTNWYEILSVQRDGLNIDLKQGNGMVDSWLLLNKTRLKLKQRILIS